VAVAPLLCPACEAAWPGRDARFCGRCGAVLVPSPSRRQVNGDRRTTRRTHARLMTVVATVTLVGALAVPALRGVPLPARTDPTVRLPERGTVPEGVPLSAEEAAALRARSDPDRLRCEPRGCERWRRTRTPGELVHIAAGRVLVYDEQRMLSLDAATGRQQWTARLDDLAPVTGDGDAIGRAGTMVLTSDAGAVLVTAGGHLVLIDLDDGARQWRRPAPAWEIWSARLGADVVILQGVQAPTRDAEIPTAPLELVRGLDRTRGQDRWERAAPFVLLSHPTVVLIGDERGELEALDPATGSSRWTLADASRDRWATVAGPWIYISETGRDRLFDPRSGALVADLPTRLNHPLVEVGERWVTLVVDPFEDRSVPTELIALDATGEIVWRVPFVLADASMCCGEITVEDGTVIADLAQERITVRASDGELLARGPARSGPFDGWRAPDGTLVQWRVDGLRLDAGTAVAELFGRDLWIESLGPDWVLGSADEQLGVRLVDDR
jgi:outer membrane protein assembly factor BamB